MPSMTLIGVIKSLRSHHLLQDSRINGIPYLSEFVQLTSYLQGSLNTSFVDFLFIICIFLAVLAKL